MQTKVQTVRSFKMVSNRTENVKVPQDLITQSSDVKEACAKIMRTIHDEVGNDIQEFFYVLFLNRRNKITGYYMASMGGITGTAVDPRLILRAALLHDCTSIILCHNHPSGSLQPSNADKELTNKIKHAASYCDIGVLDHVILSDGEFGYLSFAEEGLL